MAAAALFGGEYVLKVGHVARGGLFGQHGHAMLKQVAADRRVIHAERGVHNEVKLVLNVNQLPVIIERLNAQLGAHHVAALCVDFHAHGHFILIGQLLKHMIMYIAAAAPIAYERHSQLFHFFKASRI